MLLMLFVILLVEQVVCFYFYYFYVVSCFCDIYFCEKDDSQVRIVRENGVHCLLEYQKTIEEPELIDSINYVLCKLSVQGKKLENYR